MKKNLFRYGAGLLLAASLFLNVTGFLKDKPVVKLTGSNCGDPCKTPYRGLPINVVKSMIDEYGNNQASYINQGVTNLLRAKQGATFAYNDARSVYYELDTLQQFFCTIKQLVDNNTLAKLDGQPIQHCDLGIKIYYAAYPNSTVKKTQYSLDSYENKHTLVLVATYRDADNKVKIFDPNYFTRDTKLNMNRPTELTYNWIKTQRTSNGNIAVMAVTTISTRGEPLARNHGELCPPPRDCPVEDPLLQY
jgi:hypothetical protein